MKFNIFKKKEKAVSVPRKYEKKIKKEDEKVKVKTQARKKINQSYKVLIKPLITEKTSFVGQYNQYVFEVAPEANKIEIAKAIESVYGAKPLSVNIVKVKGKKIRYGRVIGRTKNWKKALITLKPGEKISVHEGSKD